MPFCTLPSTKQGALIDVLVMPSRPQQTALAQAGKPVPAPVPARLLIDTGASCTSIDQAILTQLNLTARDMIPIHTPTTGGTPHQAPQYDIGLAIPLVQPGRAAAPAYIINALPVIGTNLAAQGIQGLLGRDVLQKGLLTVNGPAGMYVLGF